MGKKLLKVKGAAICKKKVELKKERRSIIVKSTKRKEETEYCA